MEDKNFKNASMKEKLGMAKSFAKSIISRGLSNKKVDTTSKQLRVISCFGDNGELIPCEYLRQSEVDSTKSYCGGCGCGDKKATWLIAQGEEYSKLDYPKLACPLQMPGFTNYEESPPDEAEEPVTRRYYIEQMSIERIAETMVTIPDPPKKESDDKKE